MRGIKINKFFIFFSLMLGVSCYANSLDSITKHYCVNVVKESMSKQENDIVPAKIFINWTTISGHSMANAGDIEPITVYKIGDETHYLSLSPTLFVFDKLAGVINLSRKHPNFELVDRMDKVGSAQPIDLVTSPSGAINSLDKDEMPASFKISAQAKNRDAYIFTFTETDLNSNCT